MAGTMGVVIEICVKYPGGPTRFRVNVMLFYAVSSKPKIFSNAMAIAIALGTAPHMLVSSGEWGRYQ
jgi:hypothetical protein